jgi:hypothetical protein
MGRDANCEDKAATETFLKLLKVECAFRQAYAMH